MNIYANAGAAIVAAGLLFAAGWSAQDRAIPSPDRLRAITIERRMDMNGTPVAIILTAHFESIDAKPSGEVTATAIGSVQVDLLKNGSVVVGGEQYYDKEIADALTALAWREWKIVHPEALPQRRRALRTP